MKIVGGVPERYAQSVHTGDSAVVALDVLPDRELMGRIGFVGATVDASSRTVPIEIVLANPNGALKPSMVANVRVERTRLGDVVVVSQDVVVRTEDGYEVFLVGGDPDRPLAVARRVRLGPTHENRVVITEGLTVGELLITVGQRLVDDQSRIRVVGGGGGER